MYDDSIIGDNDGISEVKDMQPELQMYEPNVQINDSLLYHYYTEQASGTAIVQTILRFQEDGEERGVSATIGSPAIPSPTIPANTNDFSFDEDARWTRAVTLRDIPTVVIGWFVGTVFPMGDPNFDPKKPI